MKFSAKMKVSASKSATSPSCKTLADTLELHRTQTINIKKSTKKKRVLQTQNPFYFKDYKEIEYFKR